MSCARPLTAPGGSGRLEPLRFGCYCNDGRETGASRTVRTGSGGGRRLGTVRERTGRDRGELASRIDQPG